MFLSLSLRLSLNQRCKESAIAYSGIASPFIVAEVSAFFRSESIILLYRLTCNYDSLKVTYHE